MLFYKPKHFKLEELVPPDLFEKYKDNKHILWYQFDPRSLFSIDKLRELFGKCKINDWLWGGDYTQSGLRTQDSEYFSFLSQHTRARAFDPKFSDHSPEEVRKYILDNPNKEELKYITCIEEDTPTWVHIDTRNYDKDKNGILVVKP